MWPIYLWHAWRASVHKNLARRFYAAAGRHWSAYRRHAYWLGLPRKLSQRRWDERSFREWESKYRREERQVKNGAAPRS